MTDVIFQETDNLAADLEALIHDLKLTREQHDMLMLRLVSYVNRHEHTVFNHAFQLGVQKAGVEPLPGVAGEEKHGDSK